MTLTLNPNNAASTASTLAVDASAAAGALPLGLPAHMPAMIPRSQLYYWTRTWQEGEGEAVADLGAGRSRTFNDPRELARYLLRPAD